MGFVVGLRHKSLLSHNDREKNVAISEMYSHSHFILSSWYLFSIEIGNLSQRSKKVTRSFNCQTQAVIRVNDIISHKTI